MILSFIRKFLWRFFCYFTWWKTTLFAYTCEIYPYFFLAMLQSTRHSKLDDEDNCSAVDALFSSMILKDSTYFVDVQGDIFSILSMKVYSQMISAKVLAKRQAIKRYSGSFSYYDFFCMNTIFDCRDQVLYVDEVQ